MKKYFRIFAIILSVLLVGACAPTRDGLNGNGSTGQSSQTDPSGGTSDTDEWTITYTANNFFASDLNKPITRTTTKNGVTGIMVNERVGYRFLRWSDGVKSAVRIDDSSKAGQTIEALFEYEASALPMLSIDTEGYAPILSKEEYLNCSVTLSDTDEEYCMSETIARIRGRGSSSWQMPKKSYRLKFSKKTDFFGNGAAKSWTLIANYADKSLMRSSLAYALGRELEDSLYTTTTQFVDLYLNGEYLGVYLICEQTEVGRTRVDVEGFAENPEGSGFLVEMDGEPEPERELLEENFVLDGHVYEIKDPDLEKDDGGYYTAHKEYIYEYFKNSHESIRSKDWALVCSYINVGSFADTYIINELFNNVDCWHRSFYFYKEANGLLYSGPIWDYDISAGNVDYAEGCERPDYLYAALTSEWYQRLLKFDEFRTLVEEKLQRYRDKFLKIIETEVENALKISDAFERNFGKWDIMGVYVWPNSPEIVNITTWKGQVDYLKDWLLKSWEFIYAYYVK